MENQKALIACLGIRLSGMAGWKDGRMEGWKDGSGRMEGWKDGRIEGWKDRRIGG